MDRAIASVINSGKFIGGPEVKRFEVEFAGLCNTPYCIPCANGTDAIEIILTTLGIGKGDEVIIPAFSFVATLEAVCNVGATPVLCDIEPSRYTIDVGIVESLFTGRTKAVIPVHLYGQMADMDPLMDLCKSKGIYVIEDAAQAHGAEYKGQVAGSIGDMGSFSFYPGKNLGAYGDAGAITTHNEEWFSQAYKIANHGRISKYNHEIVGRNSRMDALQASILSVKLEHIREWNNSRHEIAKRYSQLLKHIKEIILPKEFKESPNVFHLYVIRVDPDRRDDFREYLSTNGIETGIHYPISLSKLKVTTEKLSIETNCPESEKASEEVVSLPIYPELTAEQQEYICDHIKKYWSVGV